MLFKEDEMILFMVLLYRVNVRCMDLLGCIMN